MSKRSNDLMAFLAAEGVLENGTPAEIAAAKRAYRKLYLRDYQRRYRKSHVEVRYSVQEELAGSLRKAAGHLGLDLGTYSKETVIARLNGGYIPAENRPSRELLQAVSLIHSQIRHLCRQKPKGFLERRIQYERLRQRVQALEEVLRKSQHER